VVFAVPATGQLIDFAAIAAHQQSCPATLQASKSSSLRLQAVEVMGASLLCDTLTGSPRPLIPTVDRKAVFDAFHSLAHAGTRATRRLIAARAVWRGMNSDVASWVRDCQQCCRGKVTGQPAAPVQPIHVPGKRFSHLHVDLVGPLPVAEDGSTYIFTMVDRSTRWLEAVPLRNMEAKTCVEAFINTWVARYGVPEAVTTDRGRQFTSALWEGLCQNLQINHISTTAYHPQSNGLVERTHRQIKDALRVRLAGNRWPEHLPWVLFGLRAAPKEDSINPPGPAADLTRDPSGGCGGNPAEHAASGDPASHLRRGCIRPPVATASRVSVRAEGRNGTALISPVPGTIQGLGQAGEILQAGGRRPAQGHQCG
jgi:transposase InsO family protein